MAYRYEKAERASRVIPVEEVWGVWLPWGAIMLAVAAATYAIFAVGLQSPKRNVRYECVGFLCLLGVVGAVFSALPRTLMEKIPAVLLSIGCWVYFILLLVAEVRPGAPNGSEQEDEGRS